jgi:ubiquinone/menaquinone biosynthesis C-methylase UbiE
MTDFKHIYSFQAEQYERLVSREDYQGNLKSTLARIWPLAGLDVVELGAGTGRITRLLAPEVGSITAFDISPHMLSVARRKLARSSWTAWRLGAADNRQLPLRARTADLAIAGWSLAHSVAWYPESWRHEIGRALAEMARVTCPGGAIILLETLGTNQEDPFPPTPGLVAYYRWLEQDQGFQRTWIRTDYAFASVQEAADLTRFFFGDEMADDILAGNSAIVPECTGVWHRTG